MLCPICHTKAEQRATLRACDRVQGMKGAYEKEGIKFGPLDHVEISYPAGTFTEAEMTTLEGYRKAYQAHEKIIRRFVLNPAGVLTLHPWRFKHQDGSTCEHDGCTQAHVPVFSPHAHYVGYGYWQRSDIVHQKTGAVYKKIQPGKKRSLFATLSYELSHCGLLVEVTEIHDSDARTNVKGTAKLRTLAQSYVYLGRFSNAKGGFKFEGVELTPQACKACNGPIHEFDVDYNAQGQLLLYNDRGPHQVKVIKGHWYLNHGRKGPPAAVGAV